MTTRATRAHALRELFLIREQLQRLKEQCEPLTYPLAQQLNICLHSVRTAEGEFTRNYIPEGER